jgi:hypothetical protein
MDGSGLGAYRATLERVTVLSFAYLVPRSKVMALLLLLFVTADLFFVGLHMAFEYRLTKDPLLSLEGDRVASEFWQYVKEYWIVLAMSFLFQRVRQPIYAAWAVVFAYILADDALRIVSES